MNPYELSQQINRRRFLGQGSVALGAAAAASLGLPVAWGGASTPGRSAPPKFGPHFAGKAKRVIYLFQSGAPSQFETFDYKPNLADMHGDELPGSIRMGQRLTTMSSGQSKLPIAPSKFGFKQYGKSGTWISDLLPHTGGIADDICIVRSMVTEAINHDPAITFFQTGSQLAGRPSAGAWVAYGMGSENVDLPAFVVLVSRGNVKTNAQPLYDRLWGSGFLPSRYQGVKLRSGEEPVLYLTNPAGCPTPTRRRMLDDLSALNQINFQRTGDPEIETRIAQYELAFRMQTTVPDLVDISDEPEHILEMYGPEVRKPGTYARNCLLARRMAERNVRFIQLYNMGWDQHVDLPKHIVTQCRDTDQPTAALVKDLKQRGLLEDTLIVWGGEFGRTTYSQGELTATTYGRDHHPRCFSIWLAGAGIKAGTTYGSTDDFAYNVAENPVEVFDLNATMLHLLGLDHTKLTYQFQGRDFRLTDVHGQIVHGILS